MPEPPFSFHTACKKTGFVSSLRAPVLPEAFLRRRLCLRKRWEADLHHLIIDGRARHSDGHSKPAGTWEVFIKDHHEGLLRR